MEPWRSRRELLSFVRSALANYGIKPKRRLGQSFTVDPKLIKDLVAYADVRPSDEVLEVGGGLGCLTKALALKARKVVTVEVDPGLARALRDLTSSLGNVEVVEADFLELDGWRVDKVVSTAPYSIASLLVLKLVTDFSFEKAVLTFQREFAERLIARPGTTDYGRLTVVVSLFADVKLLRHVSRRSFYPTPDVDSAVVEVTLRKPPFEVDEGFLKLVEELFTQRNRLVLSVLKRLRPSFEPSCLSDLSNKRVRDLTLEDLRKIYLSLGGGRGVRAGS
ncbi:MAG: ribosomal RNA small subunit methyltransferase A [Thermoprotei archaeon]|nr:MAG: ribosomal RNA small subunit methyltransferase A [Thermoprotei archaeon]